MDPFEKHIRENVAQFNDHTADKTKLWKNIARRLDSKTLKRIPLWQSPWLKVAASIVVVLGITAFIGLLNLGQEKGQMGYVIQELQDIDNHYQNLVSHQVQLVRNHPKLSEADKVEFLSFMDELDVEYQQLRLELQNNLDNEQILEAIIANYKKRIELIEHLLQTLKDSKITPDDHEYIL